MDVGAVLLGVCAEVLLSLILHRLMVINDLLHEIKAKMEVMEKNVCEV